MSYIFNLAPDKAIIITLEQNNLPIDADCPCHITFNYLDQKNFLTQDTTLESFIAPFHKLLRKGLHQQIKLHPSMVANPGYLYNQWLNEENSNLFNITDQHNEINWVGFKYQLTNHPYASWIYNNAQGDIIFEMTAVYPASLINENNPIEVQAYKKWMQNYKPFIHEIISKETAQQWLQQTTEIMRGF